LAFRLATRSSTPQLALLLHHPPEVLKYVLVFVLKVVLPLQQVLYNGRAGHAVCQTTGSLPELSIHHALQLKLHLFHFTHHTLNAAKLFYQQPGEQLRLFRVFLAYYHLELLLGRQGQPEMEALFTEVFFFDNSKALDAYGVFFCVDSEFVLVMHSVKVFGRRVQPLGVAQKSWFPFIFTHLKCPFI